MRRVDFLAIVLFIILTFFLTADLFFHPGRSITFDGHVHITTIAQFYNALKDGEFPVRWADGFANYGHPVPIFAHQTTSYVGALFQFFTHNAVLSYNLVVFVGAFLSAVLFYRFLRFHFSTLNSFAGATLFMYAPYRIVNIYVRGAVPELFGTAFLPLVLIGMHQALVQKRKIGFLWVTLGVALLALTHPMMLVISSILFLPYALYLLWPLQKHWMDIVWLGMSGVLGLGLTGYYLVPLFLELKYVNYGSSAKHFLGVEKFLSVAQLFHEQWGYFGLTHPGPRMETITVGWIEWVVMIGVLVLSIFYWKKHVQPSPRPLLPWFGGAALCVFLVLPVSLLVYENFLPLNNIQYPWRVLSALMFIPGFLLAWVLERFKKTWLIVVVFVVIALARFPQLYGKNFMEYDLSHYDFTTANLHTNNMNTLWMGMSRDYPVHQEKGAVIEGTGTIKVESRKNASRIYTVHAETPVRMVDYTFYFPGWTVYVDEIPVAIEFQDPEYRGVITYRVPTGDHHVEVVFKDTKIRMLGNIITIGSVGILVLIMLAVKYRTKQQKNR